MSKINPFTIRQAQNPGNPLTENLDFQPQTLKTSKSPKIRRGSTSNQNKMHQNHILKISKHQLNNQLGF